MSYRRRPVSMQGMVWTPACAGVTVVFCINGGIRKKIGINNAHN